MNMIVIKRDGAKVPFDPTKIEAACRKAGANEHTAQHVANEIALRVNGEIEVEEIQDAVETALMEYEPDVAKKYIKYRAHRDKMRGRDANILISQIVDVKGSNIARDNANMNAYTPSGMMYKFGSIASQQYAKENLLSDEVLQAMKDNIVHVHDLDYYAMRAVNCLQHPLDKVLTGFRANHAANRGAKRIESAATMAAISLQTVQNEMYR